MNDFLLIVLVVLTLWWLSLSVMVLRDYLRRRQELRALPPLGKVEHF